MIAPCSGVRGFEGTRGFYSQLVNNLVVGWADNTSCMRDEIATENEAKDTRISEHYRVSSDFKNKRVLCYTVHYTAYIAAISVVEAFSVHRVDL